ncbi:MULTISPECIES: magnesium/cobalt transporter CorA [Hyphomicrobiales]|uniref:magnesium/cobalt transporter CorA n=1 Tax=Hoeflea sp. 108 TaxID=1116369 RepID=UPI00037266D2|nr:MULTISPECIES: magnesium/cobalt transporter CorA [Phyllobacteriaceae]MCX8570210.1 magnesium/cobalt transporter CorA [Aminobacter sp. MET-1]
MGASPGTLIADPAARQSALNLTLISPEACEFVDNASLDDVAAACEQWPLIWLDCVGLANVGLIEDIGRIFGLHTLALEDVVNTGQRPKAEFFDEHAFFVLSMIDDAKTGRYEQISFFFGDKFVVTFQERQGDPFEPVRRRIRTSNPSRLRHRKADYLAYALIDAVVDSYFPIVDATGDKVDAIEDELLAAPRKHHISQLHGLRRATNLLKRTIWPLRDALTTLVRADASFISAETKVYFNDTLDHSIRLSETVESQRETMIGLIEMHLSLSQARTNEIIGVLTIVSAIFIPLTFLAGIWGMNFENMPELKSVYGYPAALSFMAFVAITLVVIFKRRGWL